MDEQPLTIEAALALQLIGSRYRFGIPDLTTPDDSGPDQGRRSETR